LRFGRTDDGVEPVAAEKDLGAAAGHCGSTDRFCSRAILWRRPRLRPGRRRRSVPP
jgi:hypothetical protein